MRTMSGTAGAIALGLAAMLPAPRATATCQGEHWVSSWFAAPEDAAGLADSYGTPTLTVGDQSFRMIVTPHQGGTTARIRLSNRFRDQPLTLDHVTVARRSEGAAIQPDSLRTLTFDAATTVTVPPGADVVSDPVDLPITAWQPLTIGFHTPGLATLLTQHQVADATSYYTLPAAGDHTTDPDGAEYLLRTTAVLVGSELDVLAPQHVSTVVAFGDSITDGFAQPHLPGAPNVVDTDSRYPDFLQRRLDAAGLPFTVVDAGISGNRLLGPASGPAGLDRLDNDVIDLPGVTDVIVAEGINDLAGAPAATADQLTAGYTDVVARLHAAGLRVHLGTLSGGTLPFAEPVRRAVDSWIRAQQLSDSIIDFDAALRDPGNSAAVAPDYASPDGLHPSVAGYRRMADAIDPAEFSANHC